MKVKKKRNELIYVTIEVFGKPVHVPVYVIADMLNTQHRKES